MNLSDLSGTKTLDPHKQFVMQLKLNRQSAQSAVVTALQSITGKVMFFSKLGLGSLYHTLHAHVYVSVLYRLEVAKRV